jgi:hypothetical protein
VNDEIAEVAGGDNASVHATTTTTSEAINDRPTSIHPPKHVWTSQDILVEPGM